MKSFGLKVETLSNVKPIFIPPFKPNKVTHHKNAKQIFNNHPSK